MPSRILRAPRRGLTHKHKIASDQAIYRVQKYKKNVN